MDFKKQKDELIARLIKNPCNLDERKGNDEINKKLLALYIARCKEKGKKKV